MAIPSDWSAEMAPLFERERRALLDVLTGLDEADWLKPTPCPGWSVLGLCTHLVGGDLGLLSHYRDGFRGTPAPDGLSESAFIDWLDDLQAQWVQAARRLSPQLVVDLLRWTGPQLVDLIGRQDPRSRTAWVSSSQSRGSSAIGCCLMPQ
jgi:uncharacterized protein (TIGR03083 family)